MKFLVLMVCLGFVSALVLARDLPTVARKERARRAKIGKEAPVFTNADLERKAAERPAGRNEVESASPRRPSLRETRDLDKERAYWRRETLGHEKELARLDARIKKLEWRLREHRAKRRERGRLGDDPTTALLEESIESLREDRHRLVTRFYERARKAGAFPGWLR